MRIRLLKSHSITHVKYAIGTILNYSKGPAERLIIEGKAERYTGAYPPSKKMKTDFFKPKNNGNN